MKRFWVVILSALVFTGCGPRFIEKTTLSEPGDRNICIVVDGRERSYLLHLPPQAFSGRPLPLVVVFHGYADNAQGIERTTGMSNKADQEGFIVAYPQGTGFIKTFWNAGFCCGDAYLKGVDDLRFFRELVASLRANLQIDASRIYAAGFSNGGMLAYSIAAEMPDTVAAVAVVSSSAGIRPLMSPYPITMQTPKAPVPIISFHGLRDEHLPYEGGEGKRTVDILEFLSVRDSLAFWIRANGCGSDPMREELRNGAVLKETYPCGRADLVSYTLRTGDHHWPIDGNCAAWGECISATDVIWEFFRAHPKTR